LKKQARDSGAGPGRAGRETAAAPIIKVVLVAPRNPLNIGAAARAMSNFGFFDLRLVRPYDVAWQEARSAVGAVAVLERAKVFDGLADAVADCALVVGTASLGRRELRHPVRRLEAGGRLIRKFGASEATALVFGSEKFGLSNDDLSLCHWLLRIPTREAHESMNLGQAVAVCLYELVRDPREAARAVRETRRATAAELSRIEELFVGLLKDSGYSQPATAGSTRLKVRRLLRRMDLGAADAAVWTGMLRQLAWKLGRPA